MPPRHVLLCTPNPTGEKTWLYDPTRSSAAQYMPAVDFSRLSDIVESAHRLHDPPGVQYDSNSQLPLFCVDVLPMPARRELAMFYVQLITMPKPRTEWIMSFNGL